ncbi:monovalent cation/H+ antiporter subunit D family protein [Natronoglycomyces albus]|uniref:Monovalent cation/H+ antiporter subunit D family protein n=1 Tax=Natronoglycomyces albus TaxID=2811108 RepID=A0A895XQ87_9ACTN|nr:monovalent cation/H+ antiporter subunit D family protein [Natronoglycomyces albus]QSB05703.1 monovalent cation/H+ antiporter subunit D family protein [Natronoglycomyces albus]
MTASLLPLLVAVPLLAGGALAMVRERQRLNAVVLMGVLSASLAASVWLVIDQVEGDILAHGVAAWPFGIAIPFVADMFAALMLTVTGILALTCSAFGLASGHARRPFFAALVLFLVAGVNGALLTADLFNLFVFIEVMLLPSYALLVLSAPGKAGMGRIKGSRLYVTVNLLTSTIFLAGVAFLYGVTGTVNLGELAGAAQESNAAAFAAAICLFALSIKASVVPVHGWLARTYPSTSPAVTALFSGLHTKVAIYAIYRIYAVIFDGDAAYLWIGLVAFSLTMVIGVMGAVGESSSRSILAFHMISQIGYILLGVALFGPIGLTAGIFYLLHHMIVKASLFLSTGAVEVKYGSANLGDVSGIAKREPWVAVAFFAAALSLAGLPPFSGFVAKLTLISAAIDAGQGIVAATAILVSLITLLSMLKIWSGMFWGPVKTNDHAVSQGALLTATSTDRRIGIGLLAPSMILALLTLSLGLGAELLLFLSEIAALGLDDPTGYIQAVTNS